MEMSKQEMGGKKKKKKYVKDMKAFDVKSKGMEY